MVYVSEGREEIEKRRKDGDIIFRLLLMYSLIWPDKYVIRYLAYICGDRCMLEITGVCFLKDLLHLKY